MRMKDAGQACVVFRCDLGRVTTAIARPGARHPAPAPNRRHWPALDERPPLYAGADEDDMGIPDSEPKRREAAPPSALWRISRSLRPPTRSRPTGLGYYRPDNGKFGRKRDDQRQCRAPLGWHYPARVALSPGTRPATDPGYRNGPWLFCSEGRYLDRYAEVFAMAAFTVLVYDNPNFGGSDGLPRQEVEACGCNRK